MAQFTFNIPDGKAARVVAALCASRGLDPSPANAKSVIAEMIRDVVAEHEYQVAVRAAAAGIDKIDVT